MLHPDLHQNFLCTDWVSELKEHSVVFPLAESQISTLRFPDNEHNTKYNVDSIQLCWKPHFVIKTYTKKE